MTQTFRVLFLSLFFSVLSTEAVIAQAPVEVSTEVQQSPAYQEWARKHAEWQKNFDKWEQGYQRWLNEQSRLDDGLMISVGMGLSPTRINTTFSGGNTVEFPDKPPFDQLNLRALGGTFDLRVGWLVNNDPNLKNFYFGKDELHDQLYMSFDFFSRFTPYTQLRFNQSDSDNVGGFAHAAYTVDLIAGIGTTYIIYPYLLSFSTTIGLGLVAIQKVASSNTELDGLNIRTDIGPAVNLRIGQEWRVSENWKSGFSINYAYLQAINRPRQEAGNNTYQEFYQSHIFGIQWINTFTPPKYRRGAPPVKPQQWQAAPPQ